MFKLFDSSGEILSEFYVKGAEKMYYQRGKDYEWVEAGTLTRVYYFYEGEFRWEAELTEEELQKDLGCAVIEEFPC